MKDMSNKSLNTDAHYAPLHSHGLAWALSAKNMTKDKYKHVTEYPITEYKCGLLAGDKIRLIEDIIIRDHKGKATGKKYNKGEIWPVLSGAKEEPVVVWLLQADGERHTWDDDNSIFETFEKLK